MTRMFGFLAGEVGMASTLLGIADPTLALSGESWVQGVWCVRGSAFYKEAASTGYAFSAKIYASAGVWHPH
jgi:hypothetical protein